MRIGSCVLKKNCQLTKFQYAPAYLLISRYVLAHGCTYTQLVVVTSWSSFMRWTTRNSEPFCWTVNGLITSVILEWRREDQRNLLNHLSRRYLKLVFLLSIIWRKSRNEAESSKERRFIYLTNMNIFKFSHCNPPNRQQWPLELNIIWWPFCHYQCQKSASIW